MPIARKNILFANVAAAGMLFAAGAFAEARSFNLPADSAIKAIPAFASQAGVQIVAPAGGLKNIRTRAVKGNLEVSAALDQLIEGTGLEVASNNGSVIALRVRATPVAAAAIATPAADEVAGEDTSTVVITGSRLAQRGFKAPTPVAVVDAEEVKLSGTQNVETLLNQNPQFIGSQNNGPTANTVPGGTATLNLRGFGAQRNLVLVNGRRFAIAGTDQTTDLNTIPAALLKRTEIVTGGSSAVYGSDAITGVVNFIMRDDFEGFEANVQSRIDEHTSTPTHTVDLTLGGNFADGRGNAVVSLNYLNRGSITRGERGGYAFYSLSDGCVTGASWSETEPGTPFSPPSGQTCVQAGGRMGLIAGGSGDIPNGRFFGLPTFGSAQSNAGLDAALLAAGLQTMTSRGFTFNNEGTTARPAVTPQDDYNLGPENYLIIPQQRWMANTFIHYDFSDSMKGYAEVHFSNNVVNMQLAPTNVNGNFLVNTNNPYLSASMQEVLRQMDLRETGTQSVTNGTSTMTTTAGDGLAVLGIGRRMVEVGDRFNSSERNVFRTAFGLRGTLGDVSPSWFRNLNYDIYYSYARTQNTDSQRGSVSRSRFATALLRAGTAAPVLNPFGANINAAAASAVAINSTNVQQAEQQVLAGNISGEMFDLPAGPVDFNAGFEWRYNWARYTPDTFLSSGDVSGFNAAKPTAGSVAVKEIYGEIRAPILSGQPLAERLVLNGAFRYSDYSLKGIGGVWTYSIGGEWAPTTDLTLRSQFQHAIRAPNVGELYGGQSLQFATANDPCSNRVSASQQTAAVRAVCEATGVPAAAVFTAGVQPNTIIGNTIGGSPNVGAEESDTVTFGIVYTPASIRNLALSVDWFSIELDGAIAPLGGGLQNTLDLCYRIIGDASSEFCQGITRNSVTGEITGPNYVATTNANTGGLKTSGIDFGGRYSFPVGWGLFEGESRFDVIANWTYTSEFTGTPVQALPNLQNECVGTYGPTCGQPIPEWKGVTRVNWRTGPVTLSLRHRYIGEVTRDAYVLPQRAGGTVPALESLTNPVLEGQSYFDLSFAWKLPRNLELYGGINNVADKDPPVVGSAQANANTWAATYDVEGRVYYLGLNLRF
ncbi:MULTISPECIES: TonB-dependent receptor [Asticcacaulis]|uniref:TonB-dependent receptor n=1 Tax=Asticcacaulis TaxID=76890 RepID=UPI001FD8AA35|nr:MULTISPECIES: TonB-dependent receptor [Asticcacaulis]MBP2161471.1 outer membrane receptor protein involved in Fe transport [Asticcacaulis solisilvae]MDR6802516.1 outer membrane receptor protein involved in Fe transport [Asticcacaulis sp. BE141]